MAKGETWKWTPECEKAFKTVISNLLNCNVLTFYEPTRPIILTYDASQSGLDAVLAHETNGDVRPICYASLTLHKSEEAYTQLEKEALNIISAIR